jgi:hypothetical protein
VIRDEKGVRGGIQFAPQMIEPPSDKCPVCVLEGKHGHSVQDIKRLQEMITFLESKFGIVALPLEEKKDE